MQGNEWSFCGGMQVCDGWKKIFRVGDQILGGLML